LFNVHQADLDQLREQLEEEQEGRSDLQRMLTKANNEMAVWRHKCESGEGGVRSEEMEELKRKMNAKIMELEAQLEASQSKASSMEKAKNRLQGELEDLSIEVERVREFLCIFNYFVFSVCKKAIVYLTHDGHTGIFIAKLLHLLSFNYLHLLITNCINHVIVT